MYEGAPNHPGRIGSDLIARWGVTVFYTAPTAIRAFMKWGDAHPAKHDLSSLRLLGSVASRSNPSVDVVPPSRSVAIAARSSTRGGRRDRRDHDSPLPGATPTKPAPPRGRCRASTSTS